jgi:hypothetical protein
MAIIANRLLAVLKLPSSAPALLKVVAALSAALASPFFPNAAPVIAALTKALAAADAAETAARNRTKGTIAARNAAITALIAQIHVAKAFVQQTADADAEHAEAIITAAGMTVRKPTTRSKPPFAARQGDTSGMVKLAAKAVARRASYDWEWSADGGQTWTQLPGTLQARTSMAGIATGTTLQFRFRAVLKAGETDWSQVVTLLVK